MLKLLTAMATAGLVAAASALAASSPTVTTGHASSITSSSAVLNGTVNPNGSVAHFRFELGLTKSYGITVASKQAISGSSSVAVKLTATHLLPGTTYHYRLDASNGVGNSVDGDRTFRTSGNPPPGAATGPEYGVGTTVAYVTGVVNPHGQATSYVFQYGISTHYTAQTFPARTVPAGNKPVIVAAQLTGLGPGTLYHYRLVALHGSTVVQNGADAMFFTEPTHRARPTVSYRIRPHRARSAPFTFNVAGRVAGAQQFPQFAACNGYAVVRFSTPHRRFGRVIVALQPDCTFSGSVQFAHAPRHRRLRVVVHFRGNGYLTPADGRARHVVVG